VTKNQKQNQTREQDLLRRNVEMAEGKSPKEAIAIYRKGGKYYCSECHSELPVHTDCPACHAHIDWDRTRMESL
jgi:RNase P subunit RPR2